MSLIIQSYVTKCYFLCRQSIENLPNYNLIIVGKSNWVHADENNYI